MTNITINNRPTTSALVSVPLLAEPLMEHADVSETKALSRLRRGGVELVPNGGVAWAPVSHESTGRLLAHAKLDDVSLYTAAGAVEHLGVSSQVADEAFARSAGKHLFATVLDEPLLTAAAFEDAANGASRIATAAPEAVAAAGNGARFLNRAVPIAAGAGAMVALALTLANKVGSTPEPQRDQQVRRTGLFLGAGGAGVTTGLLVSRAIREYTPRRADVAIGVAVGAAIAGAIGISAAVSLLGSGSEAGA